MSLLLSAACIFLPVLVSYRPLAARASAKYCRVSNALRLYIGAAQAFRAPRRPKRRPRVSQSKSQSPLCRVSGPMRVVFLAAFAGVACGLRVAPRAAPARSVGRPTALRSAVVSTVDRTNWETSGRDLILTSTDGTSDIVFDAEHAPAGGDPAAIVFFSAQIKFRGASPHPAAES